jgi:hypothetical protein
VLPHQCLFHTSVFWIPNYQYIFIWSHGTMIWLKFIAKSSSHKLLYQVILCWNGSWVVLFQDCVKHVWWRNGSAALWRVRDHIKCMISKNTSPRTSIERINKLHSTRRNDGHLWWKMGLPDTSLNDHSNTVWFNLVKVVSEMRIYKWIGLNLHIYNPKNP